MVHTFRAVLARSFDSTRPISHRLAPNAPISGGGDRGWGRFRAAFGDVVSSGAIAARTASRLNRFGSVGSTFLVNKADSKEKRHSAARPMLHSESSRCCGNRVESVRRGFIVIAGTH